MTGCRQNDVLARPVIGWNWVHVVAAFDGWDWIRVGVHLGEVHGFVVPDVDLALDVVGG